MTQFYKTNTERLEKLKDLISRLKHRKDWVSGHLASREHSEDQDFQFCFMGHLSRVLDPHWNDWTDGPLYYPTNYSGGRDLVHRLFLSAVELYPGILRKNGFEGKTKQQIIEKVGNGTHNMENALVAINDYHKGDGFRRIRRVANHAVKQLEKQA